MALDRIRFPLALLVLSMLAPAAAQVVVPPRVHWIGPEAECDYATIQDALANIFNCGIFACPPGRNELHLSATYDHQGEVTIDKTFDIRGGYASCQGSYTGVKKNISSATAGEALFVIQPGNGQISNVLRDLRMFGNGSRSKGGVIEMWAGAGALTGVASLTLMDSTVTGGDALSGGGVYLNGEGNRLELIGAVIEDGQATEGGGIFCSDAGVIDFQSGFIQDNTAELSGGGIYLQANCRLTGKTSNADRQILRNTIPDSQQGQGAGIYAAFSTIDMGAINSRTRIEENIIQTLPLHDYDEPGENRGGGVHLERTEATFYNTWFRGNEAADGGAISVAGGSGLLVDRYSGPCHASDIGDSPDCSLFEYNRARGGEDGQGDEGGDGAVIKAEEVFGQRPTIEINRSTWRFNAASCFEIGGTDFSGECDIDGTNTSTTSISSTIGRTLIQGNLVYRNDIGDDDDGPANTIFGSVKDGTHFRHFGSFFRFAENTTTENLDSDVLLAQSIDHVFNNIIRDPEPDDGVCRQSGQYGRFCSEAFPLASCNLTNFADDFNVYADSIPIVNRDLDPVFIDPANEDFRVSALASPAVDRCDDVDGNAVLLYDIVGNPRGVDVPDRSHGPGPRDAGAFEAMPAGFVNDGVDLAADIRSTVPKRADIGELHSFTIDVTNTGRNSVSQYALELAFDGIDGTLESLSSTSDWACDLTTARCQAIGPVLPGGSRSITAQLSYASPGAKTVTAAALMEDGSLVELTPDDNLDSDTVTVGPGADLLVNLISADPRQVFTTEPQLYVVDVTNNGPEDADDVQVEFDVAASGGQIDSFGTSEWNCSAITETCMLPRALTGDPFLSTAFTLNVSYLDPGRKFLTATVSARFGPGDPDPSNNADADFVDVVAATEALFTDGFEN